MPNSTKYWFESNFEFTCVIDFFSDFLNNFNTLISKIKKIILIYFQTKNIFKNQLFAACGKTSAIIWSQSFHEAESISNQCLQGIW
jgi:hypothetical protein